MVAAAAGLMSYWGRQQISSSSRSIKVFAINYHQLNNRRRRRNNNNNNNNNNKRKRSQAEIMSNNMEIKDKQKVMMARCSSRTNANGDISSDISNNNAHLDDGFVLCEILSRLPVKTLMRLKSVCKHWMSSIQHDTDFHQLHFQHSETSCPLRLFTVPFLYERYPGYKVSDADLINSRIAYHTFQGWDDLFSVHGLVCKADLLRQNIVCIYNPSTRQQTQWIKVTRNNGIPRIAFGFDPVTKKHKVLCHWISTKSATCSEVLTVGDNTWRRIDQVPPYKLRDGPFVYVNGAIYWMGMSGDQKKRGTGAAEVLVVFDVGSEKYRVIPIPVFFINQPRNESYWKAQMQMSHPVTDNLLVVDERVALFGRKNKNTVSMWILAEDDGLHQQNWNWTEVIITLAFDWVGKGVVQFDAVPGTDQIIVNSYIGWVLNAYSHNWKMNTYEKLAKTGRVYAGSRLRHGEIQYEHTVFRESLFPVN